MFGLWWLLLACLITVRYFRSGVPFNLGWWGYTFPLGVYTLASLRLGATLHFGAFTAFGCVLAAGLTAMWFVVAARTLEGGWRGHLFVSPCIANPTQLVFEPLPFASVRKSTLRAPLALIANVACAEPSQLPLLAHPSRRGRLAPFSQSGPCRMAGEDGLLPDSGGGLAQGISLRSHSSRASCKSSPVSCAAVA